MLTMFMLCLGLFILFGVLSTIILVKWADRRFGKYLFSITAFIMIANLLGMFYTFLESIY